MVNEVVRELDRNPVLVADIVSLPDSVSAHDCEYVTLSDPVFDDVTVLLRLRDFGEVSEILMLSDAECLDAPTTDTEPFRRDSLKTVVTVPVVLEGLFDLDFSFEKLRLADASKELEILAEC